MTKCEQARADHECAACGGTGEASEYRPACSNEAHGEGCGCGDAPLPCPVCLGAGRISDRMPVADAMADAETLRLVATTLDPALVDWLDTWVGDPDGANAAARAAFRAVPALRGDR